MNLPSAAAGVMTGFAASVSFAVNIPPVDLTQQFKLNESNDIFITNVTGK